MNILKLDNLKHQLETIKSDISKTGFACLEKPFDNLLLQSLRDEALSQRAKGRRVYDDGLISYRGYLADLGSEAITVLTGHFIAEFLRLVFNRSFALARSSSCYTYYESGDFLSAHKDGADDCLVTMLVYLDVVSPDPDAVDTGLCLRIYNDDAGKPADILHSIKTMSGSLVVGQGSRVWHGRPTLLDGERIALLTACFSTVED